MSSQLNPSVTTAAVQCTRSIGKSIAVVAGLITAIFLMVEAGKLIGAAWYAWQLLLTDHWTNVWPATWTVWTSTLLAAWCTCMAHKLRHSDACVWFAAAGAVLLLIGAIPANCAVWATVEDWNIQATPLLDRVAGASSTVFAVVGVLTIIGSIGWFIGKLLEMGE